MAMATVTALVSKKDDERSALRQAVSAAAKARAAVAAHQSAIDRARGLVQEAQAQVAAAGVAVNAARESHAQSIADAIIGGSSPTSTSLVRIAQGHAADAAGDRDAARDALTRLEADHALIAADEVAARKAVDRVLVNLLEPTLRRLIAEANAHRDSFLRAQVALVEVAGLFDAWHPLSKEASLVGLASDGDARVMEVSAASWRSALAALRENPDAKLPAIGG
jgi:hypothetical protein